LQLHLAISKETKVSYKFDRRSILKASAAGATLGTVAALGGGISLARASEKQQIKVAGYDYDRVRAIMDGHAGIEGADVNFSFEDIYALNKSAFGPERKYEVTELGLIPFVTKYINNDFRDYTLIPVFISRTFRHRNIFVHVDAGIDKPEDLRGKRVGTPGYGMSANTWIRGFLLDEYGVKADEMLWIETTKSSDDGTLNADIGKYYFPDDFPLEKGPPGVDESELLLSGGCDALITAITPKAFLDGDPRMKRLFPDVRATEKGYYKKTGLFPIMHVVAVRNDSIKTNPGLPKAVFEMYSTAKQKAYANLETTTSLKVTLPWVTQEFEDTRKLMGKNFWPYGIEANRKELELVMRYTYEQGLVKRRVDFEELFHPSTIALIEDTA
jgi:4,5-dihydroxyphthalate decarboxylase